MQLSPFGERNGPSIDQTWIPFTQGCFVPSLVKIGPVVLEKKLKIGKVYRQTDGLMDGQTDDGWQMSSGELKMTQKSTLCFLKLDINCFCSWDFKMLITQGQQPLGLHMSACDVQV